MLTSKAVLPASNHIVRIHTNLYESLDVQIILSVEIRQHSIVALKVVYPLVVCSSILT